jgi:hypothetical protein|tara:strand:+ start:322 stop:570 length:249 start_codon:yes stop_codon:yes gene_type:complete
MEMKIKKEELELIQKQQSEVSDALRNLGVLEMQRNAVVKQVYDKQVEIEETKQELEKDYGKVNINLSDGTYSKIEEEKEGDK